MAKESIKASGKIHFTQIIIAPWVGGGGKLTYSTLALTSDGRIFKYAVPKDRWYQIGLGKLSRDTGKPDENCPEANSEYE